MEDIPENKYRIDEDIRSKRLAAALVEVLKDLETAYVFVNVHSADGHIELPQAKEGKFVLADADLWTDGIVDDVLRRFAARGYWTNILQKRFGPDAVVSTRPMPRSLPYEAHA